MLVLWWVSEEIIDYKTSRTDSRERMLNTKKNRGRVGFVMGQWKR